MAIQHCVTAGGCIKGKKWYKNPLQHTLQLAIQHIGNQLHSNVNCLSILVVHIKLFPSLGSGHDCSLEQNCSQNPLLIIGM